jgi:hypothetical protein
LLGSLKTSEGTDLNMNEDEYHETLIIFNFIEEKQINPKSLPVVTNLILGRMYLGAAYFLRNSR